MLIEYTTSYSLFCFVSDPFSVLYFDLFLFYSDTQNRDVWFNASRRDVNFVTNTLRSSSLLGSIITVKSAGVLLKSLGSFTVTRASEGSFAPLSCYYNSFFNIKQIYKPSNDLKLEQLLLGSISIHVIAVIRNPST